MADKRAIQRIVRGDDGSVRVLLIDLDTLLPVLDTTGYRIISAGSASLTPEPVQSVDQPDRPSQTQSVSQFGKSSPARQTDNGGMDRRASAPISEGRPENRFQAPVAGENYRGAGPVGQVERKPLPAVGPQARVSIQSEPERQSPTSTRYAPSARVETSPTAGPRPSTKTPPPKISSGPWSGAPAGEVSQGRRISMGGGLADLVPSGGGRNVAPDLDVTKRVAEAANRAVPSDLSFGITSGTYTPELREKFASLPTREARQRAGQIGTERHNSGLAGDYEFGPSVKSDSPELENIAGELAVQGHKDKYQPNIGIGPGYMDKDGLGRLHVDYTTPNNPRNWGDKNTAENMNPITRGVLSHINKTGSYPIPTPKPGMPPFDADMRQFANDPKNPKVWTEEERIAKTKEFEKVKPLVNDPVKTSVFDQIQPKETAKDVINGVKKSFAEPSNRPEARSFVDATPAKFAASGLRPRSDAELEKMVEMISGEMSGSQLRALAAGDPVAQQELANIITSVENRAGSKKFGNFDNVFQEKQYQSLFDTNMKTTKNNQSIYGAAVLENAKKYYTGQLVPTSYDITNYYNPKITSPAWGSRIKDGLKVGDHRFGSLPEYGPSKSFMDERSTFSTYGDRENRGSFGTRDSPGYGRSSLDRPTSSAYSDRDGRGSFGTSQSPGVGRSSYNQPTRTDNSTSAGSRNGTGGPGGQSGGAGYTPGGMNSPSGSTRSTSSSSSNKSSSSSNKSNGGEKASERSGGRW